MKLVRPQDWKSGDDPKSGEKLPDTRYPKEGKDFMANATRMEQKKKNNGEQPST